MKPKILIVEDEILIASELEAILEDIGCDPVGIATDMRSAMRLADCSPDLALIDLNLRDGPTGPRIGEIFSARYGIPVLFVTANPRLLGDGVAGTIGVMSKPYDARIMSDAVDFALNIQDRMAEKPPSFLKLFDLTALSPARAGQA